MNALQIRRRVADEAGCDAVDGKGEAVMERQVSRVF